MLTSFGLLKLVWGIVVPSCQHARDRRGGRSGHGSGGFAHRMRFIRHRREGELTIIAGNGADGTPAHGPADQSPLPAIPIAQHLGITVSAEGEHLLHPSVRSAETDSAVEKQAVQARAAAASRSLRNE